MKRRTFIKGVAASSLMSIAATNLEAKRPKKISNSDQTLTGKEFYLDIKRY